MSLAKDLEALDDTFESEEEAIAFPPSDLMSNEPPLESELHLRQLVLLIQCLEWWWRDRQDFYAFGNLTIYYSPHQLKSEKFRGPDFFVVLGTERRSRNSWVVWEENGKYPNVIVEILSPSTSSTDRGLKKQIYQDTFRTPDYFWFDPKSLEFKGFHLVDGSYQEIQPNEAGYLWSQQLQLYFGIHNSQLRLFTPEGSLLPTPEELVAQENQRVEQIQSQLEQEQQRAERLAEKLRELGIDPSEV